MRNVYDDEDEVREARPWWLRGRSSYDTAPTSPKLRSSQRLMVPNGVVRGVDTDNEWLWQGQVVEEGSTYNGDRWFYVMFQGFGVPYSEKRTESVEAAFIMVEASRGRSVFDEGGKARAQVQFLVLRNAIANERLGFQQDPQVSFSAHRYGPYAADNIQATNKWEIVQIAIDKTIRKWLRTPISDEFLVLPDVDLIYNLDWLSEVAFPEMDRGFKGIEP